MIFRNAQPSDAFQIENFAVGDSRTEYLAEVTEIIRGLLEWRDDPSRSNLDRKVVVLTDDKRTVLAIAAHERIEHERLGPLSKHRYLMVTAIRRDHQRTGLGKLLIDSILFDLQEQGTETVRWLVHAQNLPSVRFSRIAYPEADETQPPEDHPYVAFTVTLN